MARKKGSIEMPVLYKDGWKCPNCRKTHKYEKQPILKYPISYIYKCNDCDYRYEEE